MSSIGIICFVVCSKMLYYIVSLLIMHHCDENCILRDVKSNFSLRQRHYATVKLNQGGREEWGGIRQGSI